MGKCGIEKQGHAGADGFPARPCFLEKNVLEGKVLEEEVLEKNVIKKDF